jgi:uncharacterized protein YcbX
MAVVSRIFVYPVKSCRGIEVDSATLTSRGLAGDRRYMLVDSDGRFLTQRRYPRMALIETAFSDGGIRVSAPGRQPLQLPFALGDNMHEVCTVRVWQDRVEATLAAADINIWFSEYMGFACGLVWLAEHQHRAVPNAAAEFDDEVSFADGAPVLLISEASLDELNRRLQAPVAMAQFRPNLVVAGTQPHAEDRWRSVTAGEARLDVAWPCSRCVMTTIDQQTAERDSAGEPLRTLETYRRQGRSVYFGQNLIPRQTGTIETGAECIIDEIIAS